MHGVMPLASSSLCPANFNNDLQCYYVQCAQINCFGNFKEVGRKLPRELYLPSVSTRVSVCLPTAPTSTHELEMVAGNGVGWLVLIRRLERRTLASGK